MKMDNRTGNSYENVIARVELMEQYMDEVSKVMKSCPEFIKENEMIRLKIKELEKRWGRKIIGNKSASGTEIIKELGERHLKTGEAIVYTSADSVLQIACNEMVVPLKELYRIMRTQMVSR